MGDKNYRDLTTGSIAKKLYRFALPIILINLLQAVYNLVDMIIVGRFCGSSGMVAVNMGGQITMIVLCIMNALTNAESALSGQLFGKKDTRGISGLVHNMLAFTLLLATAIIIVIVAFSGPILHALNVPDEAFTQTRQYLIIYICGTYFVYIYNILYGLLRGAGESTIPMIFAIFSTILNLVLDYLFVGVMSMNAGGAAFATIIAQAFSMTLMILYFHRKKELFTFHLKELRIYKEWLQPHLKIGLPQVIQFTLTSFSFVMITALINSYGVNAAAAAGAANKIYTFAVLPGQAIMAALISFTAQNLPGQDFKRITKALFSGIGLAFGIAIVCLIICEIFPGQLLALFTTDSGVVDVGIGFMRIFLVSFVIENVMFCCFGVLTGAGYTHITMCCALASAFAVRYAAAWGISRGLGMGFNGIAVAYILAPCAALIIAGSFLLSGRWKKPRVKL